MTPDHEDFDSWLCVPPPGWQRTNRQFAITPDSSVPREVSNKELDEFYYDAGLYSGDLEDDLPEEDSNFIDEEEKTLFYYPQ